MSVQTASACPKCGGPRVTYMHRDGHPRQCCKPCSSARTAERNRRVRAAQSTPTCPKCGNLRDQEQRKNPRTKEPQWYWNCHYCRRARAKAGNRPQPPSIPWQEGEPVWFTDPTEGAKPRHKTRRIPVEKQPDKRSARIDDPNESCVSTMPLLAATDAYLRAPSAKASSELVKRCCPQRAGLVMGGGT